MRNRIVFMLGLFFVFSFASAQTPFEKELLIGGSFGTNFSTISFAPKVKTKQLMGYIGGVMLRWNTENHIGIQAEINYSQNGWDEDFENTDYKYTRTINSVEFPFLTHFYFGGERVRFFINLGPKIGYVLSESTSENIQETDYWDSEGYEQHTIPVENKFAWGLCGGPGFELRTGIGTFSLEGRYYYALGDIFGSRKEDPFPKSSSQVFSFKLAYLMPLSK